MKISAVLTSPSHTEYGEIAVHFPVPEEDYDHTMELLDGRAVALRLICNEKAAVTPYGAVYDNDLVNIS